jgi:hypothetical protein
MVREHKFSIVVRGHSSPHIVYAVDANAAISELFDELETYDLDIDRVEKVV